LPHAISMREYGEQFFTRTPRADAGTVTDPLFQSYRLGPFKPAASSSSWRPLTRSLALQPGTCQASLAACLLRAQRHPRLDRKRCNSGGRCKAMFTPGPRLLSRYQVEAWRRVRTRYIRLMALIFNQLLHVGGFRIRPCSPTHAPVRPPPPSYSARLYRERARRRRTCSVCRPRPPPPRALTSYIPTWWGNMSAAAKNARAADFRRVEIPCRTLSLDHSSRPAPTGARTPTLTPWRTERDCCSNPEALTPIPGERIACGVPHIAAR